MARRPLRNMDIRRDQFWADDLGHYTSGAALAVVLPGAASVQFGVVCLLFFAIYVFTLNVCCLRLANFGTFFSLASYSRHRSKNHEKKRREDRDSPNKRKHRWSGTKMKLAAMFQTLFTMVLTIYVW